MCTVTWQREAGGYQLLCNRDEKKSRLPARPPQIAVRDGVRYIAPVDANFGGTWIFCNELGFSGCLLNGPAANHSGAISRGQVVLELASSRGVDEALRRASAMRLGDFAPFALALIDRGRTEAIEWNGLRCTPMPLPRNVLTSSSFEFEAVRDCRLRQLEHSPSLLQFHCSHTPAKSAYSVCMHRDDAQTVSFSWIRVNRTDVDFFYTPQAPCTRAPGKRLNLKLRP